MSNLAKGIIAEVKHLDNELEMANSILVEIRETLTKYPCMHDKHDLPPPSMFYAEWIQCIISKARIQGMQAAMYSGTDYGPVDIKLITLEEYKKIWETYMLNIGGVAQG